MKNALFVKDGFDVCGCGWRHEQLFGSVYEIQPEVLDGMGEQFIEEFTYTYQLISNSLN